MNKVLRTKPMPASLVGEMQLWRQGLRALPESYIRFHKELAEKALDLLVEGGYILHRRYMADQGWFDGMRAMFAIVEVKPNKVVKLTWHDGNQEWFLCHEGGGSSPLRLNGI